MSTRARITIEGPCDVHYEETSPRVHIDLHPAFLREVAIQALLYDCPWTEPGQGLEEVGSLLVAHLERVVSEAREGR